MSYSQIMAPHSRTARELRDLVSSWLDDQLCAHKTYRSVSEAHMRHPADPFPVGFPFSTSHCTQQFTWLQLVDDRRQQVEKSYDVTFGLRARPQRWEEPFIWNAYTDGGLLGSIEMDARIGFDGTIPNLDIELIIESMKESLKYGETVLISSYIRPIQDPSGRYAPEWVQVFEQRTRSGSFLNKWARRAVPAPNRCPAPGCGEYLPQRGPDTCLRHLANYSKNPDSRPTRIYY